MWKIYFQNLLHLFTLGSSFKFTTLFSELLSAQRRQSKTKGVNKLLLPKERLLSWDPTDIPVHFASLSSCEVCEVKCVNTFSWDSINFYKFSHGSFKLIASHYWDKPVKLHALPGREAVVQLGRAVPLLFLDFDSEQSGPFHLFIA